MAAWNAVKTRAVKKKRGELFRRERTSLVGPLEEPEEPVLPLLRLDDGASQRSERNAMVQKIGPSRARLGGFFCGLLLWS